MPEYPIGSAAESRSGRKMEKKGERRIFLYIAGRKWNSNLVALPLDLSSGTLKDLPKLIRKVVPPLYQINMDSFSSSVKSV